MRTTRAAVEALGSPFTTLYRDLAAAFGLQLRPGWTFQQLDQLLTNAAYGGALRDPHCLHPTVLRPTGPSGERQKWTSVGVIIEAVIAMSTEPIPGAAAADLSVWRDG